MLILLILDRIRHHSVEFTSWIKQSNGLDYLHFYSKETTEEKKKEIWFDDVDEILIEEKSHDEELDKAENKGSSLAELEEKLVTKTGPKG